MDMSLFVAVLCAISAVLVSSSPLRESGSQIESRNDSAPIVDLGYATYQGSTDLSTHITSFLSIRYAAPPTGELMPSAFNYWFHFYSIKGSLRFQAPQAPANATGVQDATSLPPQCHQATGGSSRINPFVRNPRLWKRQSTSTSEDCLFLEWALDALMILRQEINFPLKRNRSRHRNGGEITCGRLDIRRRVWNHLATITSLFVDSSFRRYDSGDVTLYPQEDLVTDSQNRAISVFIQYRLGAFGKFCPLFQFFVHWRLWRLLGWSCCEEEGCVECWVAYVFTTHFRGDTLTSNVGQLIRISLCNGYSSMYVRRSFLGSYLCH
jgi:hypothetical protein